MSLEYLAYDLSRGDEEIGAPTMDRNLLRVVDNLFQLNATEFQSLHRLTPDLAEDLIAQLDKFSMTQVERQAAKNNVRLCVVTTFIKDPSIKT